MEPLRLTFDQPAAPGPVVEGAVRRSARASSYEAGSKAKRTLGWHAPTISPNNGVLWNLRTLRDRSRAAVRNDGYAKGIVDTLVSNLIGTGIKPLCRVDDLDFRKAVHALWLRWTDESDADGCLDFYGQQAQAARGWLEGGEVFIRLRPRLLTDGLAVPLQLQILEPELCPHTHNVTLSNGNRVRAGIEFDAIGRRVAYWFHPSRPGDLEDFDASQLRRVPADTVVHLYVPLRPGQLRGVPHLTQALIRLFELDKFDDATLLRQQLANMLVAFLTRPVDATTADLDPLTNQAIDASEVRPPISMEPAAFHELGTGESVEWSKPPDPPAGYVDFVRHHLRSACAASGVPYEIVTGDMSALNDRTMRVLLNDFRRRVQAWQHQVLVFQFCRPVYRAWMDQADLAGALALPLEYASVPDGWLTVEWQPQGWPYIHPLQDVQANKEAVRNGFKSRSAVVAENGDDPEVIDEEQRLDNVRADENGLRYDSDGRNQTQGSAEKDAASATNPGNDDDDEGAPAPSRNRDTEGALA